MASFTVGSLKDMLNNFPNDLPIETELSFMWNYPDELRDEVTDVNSEEFTLLTMKNAMDLCIFEGSWEKDNVSDVDGKFEKFFKEM